MVYSLLGFQNEKCWNHVKHLIQWQIRTYKITPSTQSFLRKRTHHHHLCFFFACLYIYFFFINALISSETSTRNCDSSKSINLATIFFNLFLVCCISFTLISHAIF
mmetsp:Transcript_30148/g.43834  ORF Transcript_30148/g.43834 Transcript_30148/m.43834 type:complete len:106 (-) Transcript_30148:201-518(-)